ncbi:MAG: nitrate reductase [Rubrivivax sp.]|nr:nitrate reductase [Rubrivivax sp.]
MSKQILMCPPTHFDVEYEINPWMHRDNRVDHARALAQWEALHDIYTRRLGWTVHLLEPREHLPDLVFTANGGLVVGGQAMLPCFRHPERQQETAVFESWFRANGYKALPAPAHDFEGEGDALLWRDVLFAGYPWRSDKLAHQAMARRYGLQVVSLQLTDARFYHLDTAFTVVDSDTVALYPAAFTPQSVEQVQRIVPKVVLASDEDALGYGLNAMSDGANIVLSDRATGLIDAYRRLGLAVWPTPIGEFQKSGGGVKCLSLELRR